MTRLLIRRWRLKRKLKRAERRWDKLKEKYDMANDMITVIQTRRDK